MHDAPFGSMEKVEEYERGNVYEIDLYSKGYLQEWVPPVMYRKNFYCGHLLDADFTDKFFNQIKNDIKAQLSGEIQY